MPTLAELPTPQIVVDETRLAANIDHVQRLARHAGMSLRPHAKTHKSPVIARRQLGRGAVGICCAKLGEAEVFAAAGIENIRLPYPINPANADRLLALMNRTAVSIIIDHRDVASEWSNVMTEAGRTLDVLIKVDVGFHRCGIDPDAGARDFVRAVAAMRGLRLRGLLSHAGHGYAAASEDALRTIAARESEILLKLKADAASDGIPLEEVSVGATPTLRFSAQLAGLTELRPGNYVYFDRTQVALKSAAVADCALTVLATVVSKPAADRIILDCGSKTLSSDQMPSGSAERGFGAVLTPDRTAVDGSLSIDRLSEEHATVSVRGGTPLVPGSRVHVLPNHSCVVSNLVDEIRVVRGEEVIETLRVAARGQIT